MMIHKCLSTPTYPKIGVWSFLVRFWTSLILVDERLVSAPCLFSHVHPIVIFRPSIIEKFQNWDPNGILNRTKYNQNTIQNTLNFQSSFWFVFWSKMSPKMDPKMVLETHFFHSFFTCGPKPRPWCHFCPLLAHFGVSWAPFWPHVGALFGPRRSNFGPHGLCSRLPW